MKRYLITGGSGFIGTNLVESLVNDNLTVLNIDRKVPLNKKHLLLWKQTDILDYHKLETEIVSFNPDVIIHLAAVTDLNGSNMDYYKTNTEGTSNIIKISKKLPDLQKVIFTSSMYVCEPGFIPEKYDQYKPHTVYGESKATAELLVKQIKDVHYSWTIIRPTSIWGPWFHTPYIDFFKVIYQGKYFDFDNTCSKTYGYIDNVIFQIRSLLTATDVHGKTFYLGDYTPVKISEWANEISVEMGRGNIRKIPFSIIKGASIAGDIVTKLRMRFPMTSFRLKNMTTDNVLPLSDLQHVVGPIPVSRLQGTKATIEWLIQHKGFKIGTKTA